MTNSNDVLAAIRSAITGNAPLAALVSDRAYHGAAPDDATDATYPFITFQFVGVVDLDTLASGRIGSTVGMMVMGNTKDDGDGAGTIAAAIDAALAGATLTWSGRRWGPLRRTQTGIVPPQVDKDGAEYHRQGAVYEGIVA